MVSRHPVSASANAWNPNTAAQAPRPKEKVNLRIEAIELRCMQSPRRRLLRCGIERHGAGTDGRSRDRLRPRARAEIATP